MTARNRRPVALFLPSLAGGGAERMMLNLAAGFSARGLNTHLVLATAEGPFLRLVPDSVRMVDLKAPRILRSLRPLIDYLKRERPMALLSALDHANLVAMASSRLARTGTRTVIAVHSTFERPVPPWRDLRLSAIPWLLGCLQFCADAVVAVSEGVKDDLVRRAGMPPGRVQVIYNPVITPELGLLAAEPPTHPWFREDRPIVLGIGRLTAQKNFPLLIDAFALISRDYDARLVILGEGSDRRMLEEKIREHDLETRVAMPGFVSNPYSYIAHSRVLTLSSDFEGLPTVLIEGLALGIAVVSTDCPSGPREILRDGTIGELVPVGDVRALAGAIARALTNPRPGPSADTLQPYTLDAVVEQYRETCRLDA
jgi:glycosyltransferase involved in cell wall biosynthesis